MKNNTDQGGCNYCEDKKWGNSFSFDNEADPNSELVKAEATTDEAVVIETTDPDASFFDSPLVRLLLLASIVIIPIVIIANSKKT